MSGDAAIDTKGLHKRFGTTVAVADLSLSVARGEIFGFLGPNGAGKTTAIKMLLALVEPSAGSGTVLGAPLGTRAVRGRIGFLPEHFRFHDCLTARELLRFHGRLHGRRGIHLNTRIEELLARVDLLDAADRPLREYSKGMLQRAGLAQALINEPELVFLDEPTSGLDPLGRRLVRELIGDLRSRGTTVFLNSHLLGEIEATCDRVAFVKHGRLIRELSLAPSLSCVEVEVRAAPVDPSTPLRASHAILDGLARFGNDITTENGLIRMRVATHEMLPQIVQWLVQQGVAIYEVHTRRKSLEEWFVEVMGEDQRPG
jgi:ABC-2 type transport system ATP-binding protein